MNLPHITRRLQQLSKRRVCKIQRESSCRGTDVLRKAAIHPAHPANPPTTPESQQLPHLSPQQARLHLFWATAESTGRGCHSVPPMSLPPLTFHLSSMWQPVKMSSATKLQRQQMVLIADDTTFIVLHLVAPPPPPPTYPPTQMTLSAARQVSGYSGVTGAHWAMQDANKDESELKLQSSLSITRRSNQDIEVPPPPFPSGCGRRCCKGHTSSNARKAEEAMECHAGARVTVVCSSSSWKRSESLLTTVTFFGSPGRSAEHRNRCHLQSQCLSPPPPPPPSPNPSSLMIQHPM